jgi:methionyl-tRNA synthetase
MEGLGPGRHRRHSRKEGEWIPNEYGGRENLPAIYFLRRLNEEVYKDRESLVSAEGEIIDPKEAPINVAERLGYKCQQCGTYSSPKDRFCPKCNRFLPDRFVEGTCPHCGGEARGDACETCGRYLKPIELKNPHCTSCGTTPEPRKTEHWFFKLSAFRDFLQDWISNNRTLSVNVKNYSLQWLKEDLVDWCITRDMKWGFPIGAR